MALNLFVVGSTDYTNNIINESYDVQKTDVFETWTDANYKIHRETIRTRIEGSFTMRFLSLASYQAFVSHMAQQKTSGGYYSCTIWSNNTQESNTAELFIEWAPKAVQRPDLVMDYSEFTVNVTER